MSLPQVVVEVGLTSASVPSTVFVLDDPARGVLDTGQLGLASDEIWTDISAYVRNWSVTRGSKRGDDFNLRYETGALSVELNDGDRRFDPDNLSGPYTLGGVSLLTPMRRIRIRAVWDGVTYPLIAGYTDDWQAAYQNNSWTYTTVTGSDALAYFSGIDRIALGVAVGALSVELNDGDRRFDPDNLSGPYTLGGVSLLTPMRRIRVRAVWNGVTYPLIAGYTDDWQAAYQNNSWTYTTVTGSDALAYFSGIDRIALGVAVGAGEDSGARVNRILDAVSWSSADRVVATGDTTLQATTLADNTLTELLLVQDTELGEFYMDSSGRAVFRNRRAILTSTRSNTSQATFGDGGYGATGEIPYADATPSSLVDSFANTISASVSGGITQTAQDTTSVSNYLVKTYQRLDLISQTDAEAAGWASYLLYQFSTPRRRWATISFNTPTPQLADVHWSEVLGLEFGDRITVKRRPAGGGSPIVRDCFVRGIAHTSNGEAWTVQLILQSADRFSFFVLDDPILGVLDSNALAY